MTLCKKESSTGATGGFTARLWKHKARTDKHQNTLKERNSLLTQTSNTLHFFNKALHCHCLIQFTHYSPKRSHFGVLVSGFTLYFGVAEVFEAQFVNTDTLTTLFLQYFMHLQKDTEHVKLWFLAFFRLLNNKAEERGNVGSGKPCGEELWLEL